MIEHILLYTVLAADAVQVRSKRRHDNYDDIVLVSEDDDDNDDDDSDDYDDYEFGDDNSEDASL